MKHVPSDCATVTLEMEIPVDWAGAIIGWFGGLILTIIITRKVWRGK